MQIVIPKVLKPINLQEYDEALAGKTVLAWVNPTLAILKEHDRIIKDGQDDEFFEWFRVILSQGADAATHVTLENIAEWREQDPSFWVWLIGAYWDLRKEHLAKKKAS